MAGELSAVQQLQWVNKVPGTCMLAVRIYKAVHLELVSDLTTVTEAFITACPLSFHCQTGLSSSDLEQSRLKL